MAGQFDDTSKLVSSAFPQDGDYKWHLEFSKCESSQEDEDDLYFQLTLLLDSDVTQELMKYTICCSTSEKQWNKSVSPSELEKSYDFNLSGTDLQESLFNPPADDQLIVTCDIEIMKDVTTTSEPGPTLRFTAPVYDIRADVKSFYKMSTFSDVILMVGSRKFEAHKTILAARSSIFEALLTNKMKESEENKVDITDITEEVFEEVLRFIYTDEAPKLEALVMDLLAAADKYNLNGLRAMCEETLYKKINLENAAEILIMADRYNTYQLKAYLLRFINTNMQKVMETEAYKQLEKSYAYLIVEALRALKL